MKRFVALFILISSLVLANPVIPEDLYLSEIYIDSTGQWQIELYNPQYSSNDPFYFSHALKTTTGYSEISELDSTAEFIVITNANLSDSLQINSNADSIQLISYMIYTSDQQEYYHLYYKNCVVVGDEEGATIKSWTANQSISRYSPYADYMMYGNAIFYKDNTPTLGILNDFDQDKGHIYGNVYNAGGQPVTNKYFFIDDGASGQVTINSQGYYSTNILARSYFLDGLEMYVSSTDHESVDLIPEEFNLESGDDIQIDLYLVETSIRPVIQNTINFNNYPQPASVYSWIFIDNTEIEASAMRVNVYALNGRKVDSFIPLARQFRYDCSGLPQGSYIMTLQHGREVLASKKLQILK